MKYVLSDVAGENYRCADGMWSESLDDAERFDHDAAKVRQEELLTAGVHTRIVETHGRKRKTSEAMVMRVSKGLDAVERAWAGKTIGIGYEADVEVGRIVLTLQPEDSPQDALRISVDVANIWIGEGEEN
jgi:hypothetical protein